MIPLIKTSFTQEKKTKKALSKFILGTKKFSMGKECFEFEKQFAKWQRCNNAILFNSGGSANLAIFQTLLNLGKIEQKSKVGFSTVTWSTNVMPIIQLGLSPQPLDCNIQTLNVMSKDIERTLRSLDVLFITNTLGFTGDLFKIKEMCEDCNVILLEDNCESIGTEIMNDFFYSSKTGNFGAMSSFSFFVSHQMSTIEGGMVCTYNEEYAEMLRIVRSNGWGRDLTPKQQKKYEKNYNLSNLDAKYAFYNLGYNLKPTEITGFLGQQQLQYLDENIRKREETFLRFDSIIKQNEDFVPVEYGHLAKISNFAIPLICKSSEVKKRYIRKFQHYGVEVRPIIAGNIQNQPFYKERKLPRLLTTGAQIIDGCGFYFGNYPELTRKEIGVLSQCLKK